MAQIATSHHLCVQRPVKLLEFSLHLRFHFQKSTKNIIRSDLRRYNIIRIAIISSSSRSRITKYINTANTVVVMFALPSDYVIAQNAGKTFAADYYGRLNVSAESVTDLFTECSRYYSMDSLNGRPTVGSSGAVREVRRFLSTHSGGRRFVKVVSVDAQTDGDERAKKNFGSDDGRSDDDYDYAFDYDDYDGDQHLAVFVHAELTDPKRPSLAPLQFVQTFRVRWLRTADRGDLFEIVITVVKTMRDAVQPPPAQQQHQLQHRHRLPDDNHNGNVINVISDYRPLSYTETAIILTISRNMAGVFWR